MKNLPGVLNRFIICSFVGVALIYFLSTKNFDIHFTLRGTQTISPDILIAHIPPEEEDIQTTIHEMAQHGPRLIIAPVSRRTAKLLRSSTEVLLIPRKSLAPDEDGLIRSLKIPHSLLRKIQPSAPQIHPQETSFINFRGPQGSFPFVYYYEIKNHKLLPSNVNKKIIILDIQDPEEENLSTPVGELSAAELIANMVDNILLERWITPLPFIFSVGGILLVTLFVLVLILSLSANLALLSIFILLVLISSTSFLLFDLFYIWLPLTAFIVQVFVSYLIFVNFKLNKKEQFAWKLEKEKIYKDEMDEMKKNFLSLFSHDLKTPIAKILGQIDIMEGFSSNDKDRIKEGFSKIRRYSNELNQYVKNILKISQIEANSFQLKREPCDINRLIQNAVQLITPLAEEKKLVINEKLEPLFSINCDKELVQQIVLNILENAVKYSPENTVIEVSSKEENEFVVVAVKDQGRGILADDQDLIWQKFSRFNEKTEGTGLGLYLVKYFVEAHNGFVFVDSQKGIGSTVGFRLPL